MNKYIYVKEVINEWDPINLLATGCPNDEYEPEITDIVKLLSNVKNVDELAEGIQNVFITWFEEDLTFEKCYPVALRLWNHFSI